MFWLQLPAKQFRQRIQAAHDRGVTAAVRMVAHSQGTVAGVYQFGKKFPFGRRRMDSVCRRCLERVSKSSA
jgi:hypothetical protein